MADDEIILSRLPRLVVERVIDLGTTKKLKPFGYNDFFLLADVNDRVNINDQVEYIPQGSFGQFNRVVQKKVRIPGLFPSEIVKKRVKIVEAPIIDEIPYVFLDAPIGHYKISPL